MFSKFRFLDSDSRSDGIRRSLLSNFHRHPRFDAERDKWTEDFDCYLHRPRYDLHVSLLSPIIGKYFDNVRNPSLHYRKADTAAALLLCQAMSLSTIGREKRGKELKEMLCDYIEISRDLIKPTQYDYLDREYEDGGWEVPVPILSPEDEEPYLAMLLSFEVRSELGGKSAVGMSNLANYMNGLAKNLAATCNSYAPCLLLTVAGPYLNIDVAAFAAVPVLDSAVSFTPLLVTPYDPYIMLRLAQILRATKTCLHELDAYYRNQVTELPPIEREQLVFPYMRSFPCTFLEQSITVHFRYVKPLVSMKLVYRVEVTHMEHSLSDEQKARFPIQVGTHIVLKFTRTYCMEAHLHCYNYHAGAPELYGIGNLPGGWIYVCMEYIDREFWQDLMYRRDVKEALRCLVEHLHSANYVHGDIQGSNVLVKESTNPSGGPPRVCLCDFDWAGLEGVATYPAFVSPPLKHPEGVEDCMPILKVHDMHAVKTRFWNHL